MAAEYMHIGIPVLNRKEGMVYNEAMKFWVSNVDDYDFKIEYLKFEEGTPFGRLCEAGGPDHLRTGRRGSGSTAGLCHLG